MAQRDGAQMDGARGDWVRIWDRPTRLVHWAIVILLGLSWYTAETHRMQIHRWSGYGVLALVAFRLYWGVAGATTARFSSFVKGPGATLAYLRSLPGRSKAEMVGHNPLGAWSIVAIMLALLCQVTFGLFAVDTDGLESGPLSYMVDFDTGRTFAGLHEWSFRALLALTVLHVAAVLFYLLYKRDNLIGPMLTGRRRLSGDHPATQFAPAWKLAVGVVIAAAVTTLVATGLQPFG